jgi:acid stress-induced BolA-like protein IbaG/YrbA
MDKLLRKVKRILREAFPGMAVEVEETVPGYKVGGFFVWEGFHGMDQLARQRSLRAVLAEKLTVDERRSVNVILTMTPDEMTAARAAGPMA